MRRALFPSVKHNQRLIREQTAADIERIFGDLSSGINEAPLQRSNELNQKHNLQQKQNVVELDSEPVLDHNAIFEEELEDVEDESHSIHSYEYPDASDSEDEPFDNEYFIVDAFDGLKDNLADWLIKYRISREAASSLIAILNLHTNTNLPRDPRTFLNTPRHTNVITMCQGQYWHSGVNKAVLNILRKRLHLKTLDNTIVRLFIFIDGASIGKSTPKCLWPVLCSDDITNDVYIVGIYYGEGKPQDANQFLHPFVDEIVPLVNEGLEFENTQFSVRVKGLICDTPAKSYVLNVVGHSGYNSCTKCCIEGMYLQNTVCFPGICNVLRSDEMFANFHYELEYQREQTLLLRIPYLRLVSNVPLDYMHLICLGVMRKLIQLWLEGPINMNVRLPTVIVDQISDALINLFKYIPSDFSRKPRALKHLKYWKTTELRLFLLYFGPLVLKKYLRKEFYENFLVLHVAITILVSPTLVETNDNVSFAENLLNTFVEHFDELYGSRNVSHNVHNCRHLANDVKQYGPLDQFSAFKFENYIGTLNKLVRKAEKPLQQISRRMEEYELRRKHDQKKEFYPEATFVKRHYLGTIPREMKVKNQYRIMYKNSFKINIDNVADNCCLLNCGTIISALNFVQQDDFYVIGYELAKVGPLYNHPISSADLQILVVKKLNNNITVWKCSKIITKLMKLPYRMNEYVVFPIIHTQIDIR